MNTFLSILVALIVPSLALGIDVNPAIQAFEKSLETKLQSQIETLVGEDSGIVVNVHINELKASPVKAATPETDIGYLPTPVGDAGQFSQDESGGRIQVESVAVEIRHRPEAHPDLVESVKQLATSSLKSLNPRVTTAKFSTTNRKIASEEEEAALQKAKEEEKERWKADLKSLLALVASLGAAVILLLGGLALARSLTSAAASLGSSLGEGLKTLGAGMQGGSQKAAPVAEKKKGSTKEDEEGVRRPPPPSTSLKDYSRNLALIKQILRETPMVFVQTVEDQESEWLGIRWMLPSFTSEEQEALKRYLGTSRTAKLLETTDTPQDNLMWLQGFVERAMLKRIQGGSLVEKTLGMEKTIQLYLTPPLKLANAAKTLNERAIWRVATEFLPKDQMEDILLGSDAETWKLLILAAETPAEEFVSAADRLINAVNQAGEEDTATLEKAKFYSATLVDPTVASLLSKKLGDDDLLLDQIAAESPHFATLVREKIWTPRMLLRVAKEDLARIFKSIGNEQRASLLTVLPDEYGEVFKTFLPEGAGKIIVLDLVKKAKTRNDARELESAASVARQFLDSLRRQAQEGKLKLTPEGAVEKPASAAPVSGTDQNQAAA